MSRKLTYEFCKNESTKYQYYTEFRDNDLSAFNKSKKEMWLKDFVWLTDNLKKRDLTSKIHMIYAYIFKDLKHVYVGRTIHLPQRHYTHLHPKKNKKDSVLTFCIKNNILCPYPIVLEKNLTVNESKTQEEYWCKYYENLGFKLINIAKTGLKYSSIGGLYIKWDKKTCNEEAKKYNTISDFRKNANGAYKAALKNKWLNDYFWLKRKHNIKGYWNYDKCFEEAKKYNTISEFSKTVAYQVAKNKQWLSEYLWLKTTNKHPSGYWDYDKCFEEAKKYHTLKDYRLNSKQSYIVAKSKKWLNDYVWLFSTKSIYDDIIDVAKQYTTYEDFKENNKTYYNRAVRKKMLKQFTWLTHKPKHKTSKIKTNKEKKERTKQTPQDVILKVLKNKPNITIINAFYKKEQWYIIIHCHLHGNITVQVSNFLKSPHNCPKCGKKMSGTKMRKPMDDFKKACYFLYGEKSDFSTTTFTGIRNQCYFIPEIKNKHCDDMGGMYVYPYNVINRYKRHIKKNNEDA